MVLGIWFAASFSGVPCPLVIFSARFTNLPFFVLGFGLHRKLISDFKFYYVVFVAQWIARRTSNPEVAGSNPAEDDVFSKELAK